MPVDIKSIYGLALFGESDFVSLSPSLSVDGEVLYDHATGGRHKLHPLAAEAVRRLAKGCNFHKWLLFMLDEELSVNEIADLILFLNGLGSIEVERSQGQFYKVFWLRLKYRLSFVPIPTLGYRRPSNLSNLSPEVLRAALPLIALSWLCAILLFGAGFIEALEAAELCLVFLTVIISSTIVHEMAHIYLLKRQKYQPLILRRGLRISVLHRRLTAQASLANALAGPLIGSLAALTIGYLSKVIVGWPLAISLGLMGVVFNLISWLPRYADGWAIVNHRKVVFNR